MAPPVLLRFVCCGALAGSVKGGSQLFDPLQGACGDALSEMWTDLFARVLTCTNVSSVARLDAVLSDDMIDSLLHCFAHAVFF
jgi:hypothetical protein